MALITDPERPGLEIGAIGDWFDSMKALDAFLDKGGFTYSCSCGLARIVRFRDREEMMAFRKAFLKIVGGHIVKNKTETISYY